MPRSQGMEPLLQGVICSAKLVHERLQTLQASNGSGVFWSHLLQHRQCPPGKVQGLGALPLHLCHNGEICQVLCHLRVMWSLDLFVNGQRLLSQTALRHGDEIAIGDFRFIVELEGPSGVDWTPSVSAAPDLPTTRLARPKLNSKDKPDSTGNPP